MHRASKCHRRHPPLPSDGTRVLLATILELIHSPSIRFALGCPWMAPVKCEVYVCLVVLEGGAFSGAKSALMRAPTHRTMAKEGMDMRPIHVRTPLLRREAVARAPGDGGKDQRDVWLKMDALQPSGSFKLRGVGRCVQMAKKNGADCVVSSSGGNAGLAAAYAARAVGIPATVILPDSTPEFVADKLRGLGADVWRHGKDWNEADQKARAVVQERGAAYVHPFHGEDTWEGHASLVEEVLDDLAAMGEPMPAVFVVAVGGGGLLMGVLRGLKKAGLEGLVHVIAAETIGADCLSQALKVGRPVPLASIDSVAKSLGAPAPSQEIFDVAHQAYQDGWLKSWTCEDRDAVRACLEFADEKKVLVEPACGAALAAVNALEAILPGNRGPVVVEVCGGSAVDMASLSSLAREFNLQ